MKRQEGWIYQNGSLRFTSGYLHSPVERRRVEGLEALTKQRLFAESVCGGVVFPMIGAGLSRKPRLEGPALGVLVVVVESIAESLTSKSPGQSRSAIESGRWRW